MNFDPFETELSALRRRELPVEWRHEILNAKPIVSRPRALAAPRWLVAAWSIAWAAILLLHFTTPAGSELQTTPAVQAQDVPALPWDQRAAAIEDLLAAN